MPTDLSNLELDEVSLVGKAANGKRFLIFKSMPKGGKIMKTKPAGATRTGAGEALVSKADIMDIVQKAIAPLQEENVRLRKTLQKQTDTLRKKDYVDLAKSHLDELGTPEEGAAFLMSLEGLPEEPRNFILKTVKQTNAMKKEAGLILYKSIGSSRPAPGSSTAQFEAIVQNKLNEIQKSDTGHKSAKVLRARAVTKAAEENPMLAKAVMNEHKQNVHAAFIGGRQ